LWFPFLPIDRLHKGRQPEFPCATVHKTKGALHLAAVDAKAQAMGFRAGKPLADARAICDELITFEADDEADADWLEQLASGCERYTPFIALQFPDALILDISGCAHLFGDETQMISDVATRLERAKISVRYATATTPAAALALARYQNVPATNEAAAVSRLPIAALGLDDKATLALRRAGLKTISDLACRPMAGLAARFGEDAVNALRYLLGEADQPIRPRYVKPPVQIERRFADPVAHVELVLAVLSELVSEAEKILEEQKRGGRRFAAILFRSDGLKRRLDVETGLPTRDCEVVMRLIRERIDTLSDPIDPGFGFDMIRLEILLTEPLGSSQLELEGGAVDTEAIAALLDRLSTRLGHKRIHRLAPRDSHIPEQAQFILPAMEKSAPVAWPNPLLGEPPQRPLFLFDPPQTIEVLAEVPDGPPHRFRWRRTLHEIRRYEGPERIAGEWWRHKGGEYSGKGGLTRDYYRVEDARGRRFWLFRHGLYDEKPDPAWYVHGLFA
jgi:protein ImuB